MTALRRQILDLRLEASRLREAAHTAEAQAEALEQRALRHEAAGEPTVLLMQEPGRALVPATPAHRMGAEDEPPPADWRQGAGYNHAAVSRG